MTPAELIRRSAEYEAEIRRRDGSEGHGPDGAHDTGHLRRVWANCQRIALDEGGADQEILLAAAWFHDLVNLPKNHPDRARASTLSAKAAVEWLETTSFAPQKLPALAHVIAAHSYSAGIAPETTEARILQDADRLDALGAIGIARMFYVAGATGSALFDPDDPLAERRAPDDRAFALDHIETKLDTIAATMQTAEGARIARERLEWTGAFRSRLLREIA